MYVYIHVAGSVDVADKKSQKNQTNLTNFLESRVVMEIGVVIQYPCMVLSMYNNKLYYSLDLLRKLGEYSWLEMLALYGYFSQLGGFRV